MESKVKEKPIRIREYARLLGVSDTSVHKAMKSGKITEASYMVDKKSGWKLIYPTLANAEWGSYHSPLRQQVTKSGKPLNFEESDEQSEPRPRVAPKVVPKVADVEAEEKREKAADDLNNASVAKLKQISEKLKIAKAQIELKELQGLFIPKKDVYDALFSFGQQMRQAMQALPDKIIDNLMACSSTGEARLLLLEAISKELEMLSDIQNRDIKTRK